MIELHKVIKASHAVACPIVFLFVFFMSEIGREVWSKL